MEGIFGLFPEAAFLGLFILGSKDWVREDTMAAAIALLLGLMALSGYFSS